LVDLAVAGWGYLVGKITWDRYLAEWAKAMLKDSINPINALNPMKKVKKVWKALKAGKTVINSKQTQNLKRFIKKIPSNSKNSVNTKIDDKWNAIFEATSQWKVPWSRAVYKKTVSPTWKTTWYTKTTYGPDNKVIHTKDKIKK
jgi:hypothetical protein